MVDSLHQAIGDPTPEGVEDLVLPARHSRVPKIAKSVPPLYSGEPLIITPVSELAVWKSFKGRTKNL